MKLSTDMLFPMRLLKVNKCVGTAQSECKAQSEHKTS